MSQGERQDTPFTGWLSITGLTQRDRQPFTLTANLESPINLTSMSMDGSQSTRRDRHTERPQSAGGPYCEETVITTAPLRHPIKYVFTEQGQIFACV